ncbi:uncharacterized protein [Drosophila kikkawai]|uniref:Uncharacterized protein n=1 Tax=Drosophila kikkawai TaxID=30033 RepID=A0A6P4INM0_DROKI|nr:uncharacterized protein LOC108080006 [Drosophila kikkawai]
MQYLKLILFVLLAGVHFGATAPSQSSFILLPRAPNFNFPETEGPHHEPKENPEPRQLIVEQPGELTQKDLGQLLLLANGLGVQGRSSEERNFHDFLHGKKDKDKDHGHGHDRFTVVVVSTAPSNGSVTNINNTLSSDTGATTGTRIADVLRTPIAYPVPYPMQYFRRRGDEDFSVNFPALYGWNEASLYGGLAGSGLGGSNGGLSGGLAGVPLVPITIGNEVRYVPLNLRMFRQLVSLPVREKDDPLEEDDLTPFNKEQEPEEAAPEEEGDAPEPGYASLSQKRKQRRRRPFQAFTQKMRQVQFL